MENLLEKIKGTPRETILNNLKNVLVWKRVAHAGDIGGEGSIKYENGDWVEQMDDTTVKLKDMKQKDYMLRCVPQLMQYHDKEQAVAICYKTYKDN